MILSRIYTDQSERAYIEGDALRRLYEAFKVAVAQLKNPDGTILPIAQYDARRAPQPRPTTDRMINHMLFNEIVEGALAQIAGMPVESDTERPYHRRSSTSLKGAA
jgi:hypothetical protein